MTDDLRDPLEDRLRAEAEHAGCGYHRDLYREAAEEIGRLRAERCPAGLPLGVDAEPVEVFWCNRPAGHDGYHETDGARWWVKP